VIRWAGHSSRVGGVPTIAAQDLPETVFVRVSSRFHVVLKFDMALKPMADRYFEPGSGAMLLSVAVSIESDTKTDREATAFPSYLSCQDKITECSEVHRHMQVSSFLARLLHM
jgi:hypothetical protein